MVKVKSQTLCRDIGTKLLYISAENNGESLMEKVCCCMEGCSSFTVVSQSTLELLLCTCS